MATVAGYNGSVWKVHTDQVSVALTAEPCEAVDTGRTLYQVTNRDKRWLDPSAATTVYVDGIPVSTFMSVCYAGGFIRFTDSLPADAEVTLDGKYFTSTGINPACNELGTAKQWTLDLQYDELDVTDFSSMGWREYDKALRGATVSLEKWWFDEFFLDDITAPQLVGFELHADDERVYYCYGYLTGNGLQLAVDGAVEETINVRVTGLVEYAVETA
jgi:hypothetical protein